MIRLFVQPPWVWRMATLVSLLFLTASMIAFSIYLGAFRGDYETASMLGFGAAVLSLCGITLASK